MLVPGFDLLIAIVLFIPCKETVCVKTDILLYPGIHADGYIVFAFPFVRSYVRSFLSS